MPNRFNDSETIDATDADWRGMLATIGIVKGQPFNPDAHSRAILDAAAKTAFKMGRVLMYSDLDSRPGALVWSDRPYVDPNPSGAMDVTWMDRSGSFRDLEARTGIYRIVYASSPAMMSAIPGQGARYVTAFKDANGAFLVGDNSYRMHLPPNIPAAVFWSLTAYDSLTASGLENGQPFPSLNKMDGPAVNMDGSTDIYLGPNLRERARTGWPPYPAKGSLSYYVCTALRRITSTNPGSRTT